MQELWPPIHPGEILKLDFLDPMGISTYDLASDIMVNQTHICEIINGDIGISVDTADRLSRYFGNSAQFWLNLQAHYDLRITA